MKKIHSLFLLILALINAGEAAAANYALSWTPVVYTENSGVVTYQVYYSFNDVFDLENLQPIICLDGSTDPTTGNTKSFSSVANGFNDFQTVYFAAVTIVTFPDSSYFTSALSNILHIQIGESAGSGPGISLMRLPETSSPDTYAVSLTRPQSALADASTSGIKLMIKTNTGYSDMATNSTIIDLSNSLYYCFNTASDIDAVYVQAEAYDSVGSQVGLSEIAFHLRGAACADITTCRVDYAHSSSIFDQIFSKSMTELGQADVPSLTECGTGQPFIVPELTSEQKILFYDGMRAGPRDHNEITTHWGNSTVP